MRERMGSTNGNGNGGSGVVKMIPKEGESSKQAVARGRRRHPGKTIVDPPPRSEAPGRRTPNLVSELGRNIFRYPEPDLYPAASGRMVATDIIRDRVMTAKLGAVLPWIGTPLFATAQITGYFQNSAAPNQDTVVNQTFQSEVNVMYNLMVRELIAGGKYIRDTILDNTGTISAFGYQISQYIEAFILLRGFESILNSGGLNYTLQLLASAVQQNVFRLEADLRRLAAFSVPPMLIRYLDRLCGVKVFDEDTAPFVLGVNLNGVQIDLTLSANVQTALGIAETSLSNLVTPNPAVCTLADAARIWNVLAMKNGFPDLPSKGLSTDMCEWALNVQQTFTSNDTTLNTLFTFPNRNVSTLDTGVIPVLVPSKDQSQVDPECVEQLYTLFRPGVYSMDPVVGKTNASPSSQVGLFFNTSTSTGTSFVTYNQAAAFTALTNTHAGAANPVYTSPELEYFVWSPEAENEAIDYTVDQRPFRAFDRTYVGRDFLIDETNYVLQKMFLS
jgi:hypothetical protein